MGPPFNKLKAGTEAIFMKIQSAAPHYNGGNSGSRVTAWFDQGNGKKVTVIGTHSASDTGSATDSYFMAPFSGMFNHGILKRMTSMGNTLSGLGVR